MFIRLWRNSLRSLLWAVDADNMVLRRYKLKYDLFYWDIIVKEFFHTAIMNY